MFNFVDHIKKLFSSKKHRYRISILVMLIVHTAGVIGIVYFERNFFLQMTAVNLLLTFVLLIWNEEQPNRRFWFLFIVTFFVGFFTEVIGVNTGLLFGNYDYINHLGPKIWEVPLLIGVNWFCVVYCSIIAVQSILAEQNLHPVIPSLGAAGIATIYDWVMEPIAMAFDYWKWENEHIPFYNYICWFCIAFLIALIFMNAQGQYKNRFAIPLIMIQFIFFVALRVLLG